MSESLGAILQSLREVDGVQGTMVVDSTAAIVAHRSHSIYDLSVLQQMSRSVISSADSVQLMHDEWEVLTAQFTEGKLLLRNLKTTSGKPRRYILVVIADSSLNVAFLGVALRVAAGKLVAELEAGPPVPAQPTTSVLPVQSLPAAMASQVNHSVPHNHAVPNAIPIAAGSTGQIDTGPTQLAKTGLTWTHSSTGSAVGLSDLTVLDPSSSAYLVGCTKALAASVGPMAKVFVKEAVRKVCGDRPFTRADGPALLSILSASISDSDDQAVFQRVTRKL